MERTIGAFIFPDVLNGWTRQQAAKTLRRLRDFGVNTIATEAETYRDDVIDWVHREGMRFVGGIACFSEHGRNHQLLRERPELWPVLENGERRPQMEWYIGVTPTIEDYRRSRLDTLERLLRVHALDGLCLDFIRWPLHWELELRPNAPRPLDSSFDSHTVRRFLDETGLQMPDDRRTVPQQAAWILAEHRTMWVDFKCRTITAFVAQVRERVNTLCPPTFQLGLYLVPALEEERAALVGQRVSELAPLLDYVAPMVYHTILHQSPAWVQAVVDDVNRYALGKVLPVLQVDSAEGAESGADWGPPMPPENWRAVACATTARDDVCGLVAFTGTSLFRDGRGAILRQCVRA